MMKSLNAIVRLHFIHIFALLAVGLSTYYPPVDILLALVYLAIISMEAFSLRSLNAKAKAVIILAWQGPGLLLFLLVISGITILDIRNYCFFIMLFWYTPLLPFLSLLPGVAFQGWPLYYYVLLALPFIMAIYHFALSTKKG